MSTELGVVADMEKRGVIDVLQFSGGILRGKCIQLTIQTPDGIQHILLDKMGVLDLATILVHWVEKNPPK